MNEKEMNLAILNKLYEIADKVFNEGVYFPEKGCHLGTNRSDNET